jgi:hypothetical protein
LSRWRTSLFLPFPCFICYISLLLAVRSSIPRIPYTSPFYNLFLFFSFFFILLSCTLSYSSALSTIRFQVSPFLSLSWPPPSPSLRPFPFFFTLSLYRMGHKRLNMFHGL